MQRIKTNLLVEAQYIAKHKQLLQDVEDEFSAIGGQNLRLQRVKVKKLVEEYEILLEETTKMEATLDAKEDMVRRNNRQRKAIDDKNQLVFKEIQALKVRIENIEFQAMEIIKMQKGVDLVYEEKQKELENITQEKADFKKNTQAITQKMEYKTEKCSELKRKKQKTIRLSEKIAEILQKKIRDRYKRIIE